MWKTDSFRRTDSLGLKDQYFRISRKNKKKLHISTTSVLSLDFFTFFMFFLNAQKCRSLFDLCILIYVRNAGIYAPKPVRCQIEFIYKNAETRKSHIFSTVYVQNRDLSCDTQFYQILSGQYVHRYARILYPKKYRIVDNFMTKIIIRGFHIGVSAALLYHQQVFELSKYVQLKFWV